MNKVTEIDKNLKLVQSPIIVLIAMFSSHVARQSFGDRKQAIVASGKRVEGDVHVDFVAERQVQDAIAAGN